MDKFPIMLFPRTDEEGRCVECGVHLNYCEDCGRIWAGSHRCEEIARLQEEGRL